MQEILKEHGSIDESMAAFDEQEIATPAVLVHMVIPMVSLT